VKSFIVSIFDLGLEDKSEHVGGGVGDGDEEYNECVLSVLASLPELVLGPLADVVDGAHLGHVEDDAESDHECDVLVATRILDKLVVVGPGDLDDLLVFIFDDLALSSSLAVHLESLKLLLRSQLFEALVTALDASLSSADGVGLLLTGL